MKHIDELLAILDLTHEMGDVYTGQHPASAHQRVFGGQVMAQALSAMYRTVDAERLAHSIKGYFLRAGSTAAPIHYVVERVRDGGSFTTRRVRAVQHQKDIFVMSASFKTPEDGVEHTAVADAPAVDPAGLPRLADMLGESSPAAAARWEDEWAALDVRAAGMEPTGPTGPHLQVWLRTVGDLPDDPRIHQEVLAYASDLTLLAVSLIPHPEAFATTDLQMATIDHSLWFHRPLRADDWVLYDQTSPNAGNALGLSIGRLHDRSGTLGAHAVQEGLIRIPDGRERRGLV